jgi:hypothetical protein
VNQATANSTLAWIAALAAAIALLSMWLRPLLALDSLSLGASLILGGIGIVAILYAEDEEDEHMDCN